MPIKFLAKITSSTLICPSPFTCPRQSLWRGSGCASVPALRAHDVARPDEVQHVDDAILVDVGLPVIAGGRIPAKAVADEDQVEDIDAAIAVRVAVEAINRLRRRIFLDGEVNGSLPEWLRLTVDEPADEDVSSDTTVRL